MIDRLLWLLLRFSLPAWVGAASLFVVTGVREVTSPRFDSLTKNQLALIRFPAYYTFGFVLVLTALLAACGLMLRLTTLRKRLACVAGLVLSALVLMVIDYQAIYTPLAQLMLDPEARKGMDFLHYHQWSKWINATSLVLCLLGVTLGLSIGSGSVPGPGLPPSQFEK